MMLAVLFAVIVGTWNGEWFPSGRAEHRAPAEQEERTIRLAGEMIRKGFAELDPEGKEDLVLCLNEIRGPKAARSLCEAIGRTNLTVAVVSGYRRRDRFDMQQDVIATTLPVATSRWSKWKAARGETPPRGYAYAEVVFPSSATVGVYAVHLKSNYAQTSEGIARTNRVKRTRAIRQIVEQEKPKRGKRRLPLVIAGDFNADAWSPKFKADEIFSLLDGGGFSNALAAVEGPARVTYPGRGRWGDSVFDYVFTRDVAVSGEPLVYAPCEVSDHRPVFVRVDCALPERGKAKEGRE